MSSYFNDEPDYTSSDDEIDNQNKKKDEEDEDEEDEDEIIGGDGEDDDIDDVQDDIDDDIEEDIEDDIEEDDVEDDDVEDDDEADADADEQNSDTEYVNEENPDEEENPGQEENKQKKTKKIPTKNIYKKPTDYINDDDEDNDDDDDGEQYLQKFDHTINDNYVLNYHPETVSHNYDEIEAMTKVVRNSDSIIIDKLHRTIPFLTKYEKARILGQRAKQINSGAYPLISVPENVIDGLIIAELELTQKRIPFIIRRPLPNGGSEYWKVKDLEDISF